MDQQQREHDDLQTGLDLPNADGQVSDEDAELREERKTGTGGQDHSLERHEQTAPTSGVGNFQDSSDTTSDIAHIDE
jgi:hypothetical protein